MEYYLDQLMCQQQNHLGLDLWLPFHRNEGQSGKTENKKTGFRYSTPLTTEALTKACSEPVGSQYH